MGEVSDDALLEAQIGRPLRAASRVVKRCGLGLPVVAQVPPHLQSGEPFPTRYWLTCPLAQRRIARLEARGEIRTLDERAKTDMRFAEQLENAHRRYAAERRAAIDNEALRPPSGGVAGSHGSIKCLHAHYADFATGHKNPVGQTIVNEVEPLNCTLPCVVEDKEHVVRNPRWREPSAQRPRRFPLDSALVTLILASVIACAGWLMPEAKGFGTHTQLGLPPCGFRWLTGWPCPGCGLTTAFAFAVRGDLLSGFQAHPIGVLLFGATLAGLIGSVVAVFRGRGVGYVLQAMRVQLWMPWLLIAFAVVWIIRLL